MTTVEDKAKESAIGTIDPVCGMNVKPDRTKLVSVYRGHSYWFCAEACRSAFEADPDKYLQPKSAKKKGWFRRYLERISKANEKEFGCSGPSCH